MGPDSGLTLAQLQASVNLDVSGSRDESQHQASSGRTRITDRSAGLWLALRVA
jgi:hypothetical protein